MAVGCVDSVGRRVDGKCLHGAYTDPRKQKSQSRELGYVLNFFGVADGTRTHDDRNHNPGLYQLSYSHH